MREISAIFNSCRSDKCSTHSYGDLYARVLDRRRGEALRILEIGIDRGRSLRAWREICPAAEIWGVDIRQEAVDAAVRDGFRAVCANAADAAALDAALGDLAFDLVVDDGSHREADQIAARDYFLPRLNPGGVLVIEDVQQPESCERIAAGRGAVIDLTRVKNRYDDRLVVFARDAEPVLRNPVAKRRDAMIWCTLAEHDQARYIERVVEWQKQLAGVDADLYVICDGAYTPDERITATVVSLTPALGRQSTNVFPGWRRSLSAALKIAQIYQYCLHLESDVKLQTGKVLEYLRQPGLWGSICPTYGFLETGVLVFNDKEARKQLGEFYHKRENQFEQTIFESSAITQLPWSKVFSGDRVEGHPERAKAEYDYLAQYQWPAERAMAEAAGPKKRRLLITCGLCPGDILMLTAAIRDLVNAHHDKFSVNVQTSCMELWENNPYLDRSIDRSNADRVIEAHYTDLINHSNQWPRHFIEGYRMDLEKQLGVTIPQGDFRCDVHLSAEERAAAPAIAERYWIVDAGYKDDYPIKRWGFDRYQEVVDALAGEVKFVQIGLIEPSHHHPDLTGVIDLRGKTSLREMVTLMYHASGVLTPISFPMHLATMATDPERSLKLRPAVVLAGGREPAQFVAYPAHRFLSRVAALPCCDGGGCWHNKLDPAPGQRSCLRPVTTPGGMKVGLCMELVTVAEVVAHIRQYEAGWRMWRDKNNKND